MPEITPREPLTFEQVLNLHKRNATNPAAAGMDLPTFAKTLNELSDTDLFNAGLKDSKIKRFSLGFDELLRKTGVPQASGELFEGLGGMFGEKYGQIAKPIGEGIPRALIEGLGVGLAAAGGPLALPVGLPLAALGTGSAFAKGYTDTDSVGAGAISGAANLLFPTAGRLGARYITGPLSKRIGTDLAGKATRPALERFVDLTGMTLGTTALAELANQGTSIAVGQGLQNPLKMENLFSHVASQAAFMPFQAFSAIRGPKRGEFESVGQQIRAEEFARQKAAEAAQKTMTDRYINRTEETYQGGEMPGFTELGTRTMEAQFNREATLFGKPLTPSTAVVPPSSGLLMGGEMPSLTNLGDRVGVETSKLLGAKEPKPVTSSPEPVAIVEEATKAITEGRAHKGVEGMEETAQLANAAAEANGKAPVITDATLSTKAEALAETKPLHVVKHNIAQSVENTLNQEAGELSVKQANEKAAAERLAGLPDNDKNFLAQGIVEAEKKFAGDAASDIVGNKLIQAALNWYDKHQGKPFDPEKSKGSLVASLVDAGRKAIGAFSREEQKHGVTRREDTSNQKQEPDSPVDVPRKTVDSDDPFHKEAVARSEERFENDATQRLGDLVSGGVTADAAKSLGIKSDASHLARLSAVIRDIALNASFGDKGSRSKKGFRFIPSKETFQAFGTDKQATIQKWVIDNLADVKKIVEAEVLKQGGQMSLAGELVKQLYMVADPKVENQMGAIFAAGARQYFMDYALAAGHNPESAGKFADAATAVASVYKEVSKTRIAQLVNLGNHTSGVAITSLANRALGVIGIDFLRAVKVDAPALNMFSKLLVMGHEMYHRFYKSATIESDPVRHRMLAEMHAAVDGMDLRDKTVLLAAAFKMVIPDKFLKSQEGKNYLDEVISYSTTSTEEFLSTYTGLLALGAARGSGIKASTFADFKEMITYSDKQFSDFAMGYYVDLAQVSGALKEFTRLYDVDLSKEIDLIHGSFKEMAQARVEIDKAVSVLQNWQENLPQHWLTLVARSSTESPIFLSKEVDAIKFLQAQFPDMEIRQQAIKYMRDSGILMEKQLGKRPNWFERNIMIPAHLRELYPVLNDVTNIVFGFRGDANNFITKAMAPFGEVNKLGKVVFKKDSPLIQVRASEQLEGAASEIFLEQNWQKKALTREDAEGLTKFATLTPEQKDTVWAAVEQTRQSMNIMGQAIVEYQKKSVADALATVALGDPTSGIKSKQAISMGDMFTQTFFAANDPANVLTAPAMLSQLQTLVSPELFVKMKAQFDALMPKFKALETRVNGQKDFYTPETRMGEFYIRYTKEGVRHFVGLPDEETAAKRLQSLQNDATVDQGSVKMIAKYQKDRDVNTLYTDIIGVFSDIEKEAYQAALRANPEAAEVMGAAYKPGEATFREIVSRGFGKHFQARKLIAGREEINMMQGIVAYVEGMSMGMAKALTKRRSAILLADPEMKQNPDLRHMGRDYVINVVDPPANEWTFVKNMAFQYFLGGNLSSLAVESFQPLFTLAPELTRQGAGIAGGYKLIAQALKATWEINATGKPGSLPPEWRVMEALRRASDEQRIDFGIMQELEGLDTDSTIASLRNVAFDGSPVGPTDLIGKPLYWYGRLTRTAYRAATSHNSRIAFLAGFLQKMKEGASWDDAYNYGVKINEATMFGGGAASRPMGLFSRLGKTYGAVGALYTLRHYSVSMMSDWYRMIRDSLPHSGLDAGERSKARKALGQMAATQFLMAGAMGLPMVSGVASILEQLFPNLQLKAEMRQTLASLAGDDEELGQVFADLGLKGVLTTGLPIDLQSRFGLGDAFGLNPNQGFSPATVFGAPGSLFERAVLGVQSASTGDAAEATRQVLPNSFSNLIKLYSDDLKVRDKSGNLIYEPTESEVALSLIGFRPKQLTHYREQQALQRRADDVAKRDLSKFHSELSDLLLKGQTEEVRKALVLRAESDETYDPRAGLRAVVNSAQAKTMPVDLTRTGMRAAIRDREDLSRTFPQRPKVSEVDRLMERKTLERSVGIPGAGQLSRTELSQANLVDRLMQMNPLLTRQHALVILERLRARGPSRQALSVP